MAEYAIQQSRLFGSDEAENLGMCQSLAQKHNSCRQLTISGMYQDELDGAIDELDETDEFGNSNAVLNFLARTKTLLEDDDELLDAVDLYDKTTGNEAAGYVGGGEGAPPPPASAQA